MIISFPVWGAVLLLSPGLPELSTTIYSYCKRVFTDPFPPPAEGLKVSQWWVNLVPVSRRKLGYQKETKKDKSIIFAKKKKKEYLHFLISYLLLMHIPALPLSTGKVLLEEQNPRLPISVPVNLVFYNNQPELVLLRVWIEKCKGSNSLTVLLTYFKMEPDRASCCGAGVKDTDTVSIFLAFCCVLCGFLVLLGNDSEFNASWPPVPIRELSVMLSLPSDKPVGLLIWSQIFKESSLCLR